MLLKTPFQKICYKLFLALIALVYSFSAYVAPSDAQPIAPHSRRTVRSGSRFPISTIHSSSSSAAPKYEKNTGI